MARNAFHLAQVPRGSADPEGWDGGRFYALLTDRRRIDMARAPGGGDIGGMMSRPTSRMADWCGSRRPTDLILLMTVLATLVLAGAMLVGHALVDRVTMAAVRDGR